MDTFCGMKNLCMSEMLYCNSVGFTRYGVELLHTDLEIPRGGEGLSLAGGTALLVV